MYVLYESVSYSGVKSECIYLERIPRKLFNILTKRNINEASAVYNGTIRLKCNGAAFILNKIAPVAASEDIYYVPPNCIYSIKQKRFMGQAANSMFIGDKIYCSNSLYGLFEVDCRLIVGLTADGPKVIEGLKTTMFTGGHEHSKGAAYFYAYGIDFDYFVNNSKYYPLFMPVIPDNVYENNLGQLAFNCSAIDGDEFLFNEELEFSYLNFYKNEDWPLEIVKNDGGRERYNFIIAVQRIYYDYRGSFRYEPFLVNRQNVAIAFDEIREYGSDTYPRHNKYGPIEFSNSAAIYKDRAGNTYELIKKHSREIDNEKSTYMYMYMCNKLYITTRPATRTKSAIRVDNE